MQEQHHTSLDAKQQTIDLLTVELMSVKGVLNALLINKKKHKKENTKLPNEQILISAANLKEFKKGNLIIQSGGKPSKLYEYLHAQLSSQIHQQPRYGSRVRKMICITVVCIH